MIIIPVKVVTAFKIKSPGFITGGKIILGLRGLVFSFWILAGLSSDIGWLIFSAILDDVKLHF
jgi:hypothetical protein